jgi:hypothetical protein
VCQLKCSGAQGRCLMVTKDRRIGNQVRAGTRSQQPNEALVWKQETLLAMVSPLFPPLQKGSSMDATVGPKRCPEPALGLCHTTITHARCTERA